MSMPAIFVPVLRSRINMEEKLGRKVMERVCREIGITPLQIGGPASRDVSTSRDSAQLVKYAGEKTGGRRAETL